MADEAAVTFQDTWSYRLIIIGLVVVLFVIVTGMIVLPFLGKEMPSELSNIAMPIIAGLLAILRIPTATTTGGK